MRFPDLIIIGAMKCATSTLHKQLAAQKDIFMSEPKEPNFFSDDDVYARGPDWYVSLFETAGEHDLVGESSTHYTKMPNYPLAVARMAECIPRPKLVYIMRHPVERLISHYIHDWSEGKIDCGLDEAIEKHPEFIDYGRYAYQLEPYFGQFGTNAILPVLLPRLRANPQAELERICNFIGYEGTPKWRDDLEKQNVSRDRIRRFPLYSLLVQSDWATKLRHSLVPRRIRESVKARFQLRERPKLSSERRTELESIFDSDLKKLRSWLKTDLNCINFNNVSASQ